MSVPTVKRDFFEKVLGRDRYAKIEASLGERAATMTDEEFVTAFKAVMDETETKDMATMTPAERKAAMSKMTPEEKAAAMAAMGKSIDDEGNIVEKVEEPKDDEKALAGMKAVVLEGMKEALTPIQTSLKELTDWKATVDAKIIALEKSEDERIASMFGIRGLQPGAITAPVDSDDNLIDGRAMRALKSALGGAKDEVKSPVAPMVEMLMADLARGVSA